MSQKKNEGILFPTEIRVVGSYTDRLLISFIKITHYLISVIFFILIFIIYDKKQNSLFNFCYVLKKYFFQAFITIILRHGLTRDKV